MTTKIKKNRILSTDVATLEGTGASNKVTSANLADRLTDVNTATGFVRNFSDGTNGQNSLSVLAPTGPTGRTSLSVVSTDSAGFLSSAAFSVNAATGVNLSNGSSAIQVVDSQVSLGRGSFSFSIGAGGYAVSDAANFRTAIGAGAVNGLATLDSGGKIPESQLPASITGQVEYKGTWNASTNTPTLATSPASTTKGDYYITTVAGTFNSISYAVGDWIISDGTAWAKVDNTDAVSTVFGRTGAIVAADADYTASQIVVGTIAGGIITADRLQAALAQISAQISIRATINSSNTFGGSIIIVDDLTVQSLASCDFLKTDAFGNFIGGSFGTGAGEACQGNDSRLTNARTPTGSAGGDLAGTYPSPTLTTTGVTAGTYTNATVTVDAKGRVTFAESGTGGGGGGGGGLFSAVDLTGTANGTNTNFTIPGAAIVVNSEMVFLNGQLLRRTIDYTISGSTVTFLDAPVSTDWLAVSAIRA